METVVIFNILRNVPQINEEQAHELAEAIGGKSDFATKADIARLEGKIDRLEGELGSEIKAIAGQAKLLTNLIVGLYVAIAAFFLSQIIG